MLGSSGREANQASSWPITDSGPELTPLACPKIYVDLPLRLKHQAQTRERLPLTLKHLLLTLK